MSLSSRHSKNTAQAVTLQSCAEQGDKNTSNYLPFQGIIDDTFYNSILFHRRNIKKPDVIVKPDGENDMSLIRKYGEGLDDMAPFYVPRVWHVIQRHSLCHQINNDEFFSWINGCNNQRLGAYQNCKIYLL